MGRNGCLALVFGLLIILGMIGPDFLVEARSTVWRVSCNLSGGSARSLGEMTGGLSQGVVSPLNFSRDSARPLFEVPSALSQIVRSRLNLSGNSVGHAIEALAEKAEGAPFKLEDLPGFDVINKMSSYEVLVQCVDSGYPDSPVVVNKNIPVGELDTWNLQDIDPTHVHIEYKCFFLLSQISPPKHMSAVVWVDSDHRNDEYFYCFHCQFQVYNDGLYVVTPGSNGPFFKLQDWQPFG